MAEKTAAQKLEALLEKATGLIGEIEIDAVLRHDVGSGNLLAGIAAETDEEINKELAWYGIDAKASDDVRVGIRLAAAKVGSHDLDVDYDEDAEQIKFDQHQHEVVATAVDDDVDELEA